MANVFTHNFSRKLAKTFLLAFETERILSKNVNTQLLQGKFGDDSGEIVDFKRPTDYKSIRTTDGDVSGSDPSPILTGKASGVVQDYFTVYTTFGEAEQALRMNQLKELLAPMAKRIVTDLEVDYAKFMLKNVGLLAGDVGTPASKWEHVSLAGALLKASGVPADKPWYYAVNPFTQVALSGEQRSIGAGGPAGALISEAHRKAIIAGGYAGFDEVLTATSMATVTTGAAADKAGVLAANPLVTYNDHAATMIQDLSVSGFTAGMVVKAGEVVSIAGRYRLNLSTRQPIVDASGSMIVYTGTVVEDVTLTGGAGVIKVAGPAIYEATGAYNTVYSAPIAGDVVTILNDASALIQPNMFWHKDAFSIGSVPMEKLYSTDSLMETHDGLMLRVSKGTGFLENKQLIRFDLRVAYAVLNPFFAGQGFGVAA